MITAAVAGSVGARLISQFTQQRPSAAKFRDLLTTSNMRVCHFVIVASTALLAAVSANAAEAEAVTQLDVDGERRNLRTESLLEWPERLEEYVENHHHIREIFTRWCLEEKEPKEAMEEAENGNGDKKTAALYHKYREFHSEHGRKLYIPECNL
ncbi:unnamed protein product [Phytophthora fragariaefolia]|uniref:Unnamed protein product n=1 Tax=Phytophthora fragariaefolia TaxID=1490495 RepID=A0A9W6X7R0_9STRA|nr:unnamed protein product [Phytophthora fragariaefolia]